MSSVKILFGRKIKECRKKKGLTQAQLAELINVDNKHVSCIESGKNFPSADLIDRIVNALEIEYKNLFEFYYLAEPKELKKEIINIINKLPTNELTLAYKYIKTFLL